MNNWDQYRRNAHRAANGGNYRQHDAGKGDVDRSTHLDTYKLGAELIRIAADKGRDSKEYQETYDLWKAAVRKASGIKDE